MNKSEFKKVPTTCVPWPTEGLRRISINSFGFGGSNGHLILDDAFHTLEALDISSLIHIPASFSHPVSTKHDKRGIVTNPQSNGAHIISKHVDNQHIKYEHVKAGTANGDDLRRDNQHVFLRNQNELETQREDISVNGLLEHRNSDILKDSTAGLLLKNTESLPYFRLLVWSAKDEAALQRMLQSYQEYFDMDRPEGFIEQLAYTLSVRRSTMLWRSFAIVSNQDFLDTKKLSYSKLVRSDPSPGALAFVFTGQGAQYVKMGLELRVYPIFYATLSRSSNILGRLGADWSLFGKLKSIFSYYCPLVTKKY
jgi:acyl transferase domain-containing protein